MDESTKSDLAGLTNDGMMNPEQAERFISLALQEPIVPVSDDVDAEIEQIDVERRARIANGVDLWDQLWRQEGDESWRQRALSQVYTRIARLMPQGTSVVDIGGGIGLLARRLRDDVGCKCLVLEQSPEAVEQTRADGLSAEVCSIGDPLYQAEVAALGWRHPAKESGQYPFGLVATEVYEHLPTHLRERVLTDACSIALRGGHAFISVPNDRLGPDEEPQHTCKYTALSLLQEARAALNEIAGCKVLDQNGNLVPASRLARVEVLGPYLLLILSPEPKQHTLSVCTPARDEGADLEAVLASFRGVADEIVVGVDPRTTDDTRAIAEKYAEVVFDLVSPEGPPDAPLFTREQLEKGIAETNEQDEEFNFTHVRMPPGTGVNFAWIRNQCLDHCTGDWIFMTEAHERLLTGEDVLLRLGEIIPKQARIGMVLRTGTGQQWGFPWLARRAPDIRYKRAIHNILDFPAGTFVVQLPQIRTLHDRVHERTAARAEQRAAQNRTGLLGDWLARRNEASLFYFASELRDISTERSVERMREFLAVSRNGGLCYQARLIQAKELCRLAFDLDDTSYLKEARDVLIQATGDDWCRGEHWLRLGDLATHSEQWEEAYRFYTYAATFIGQPPFTSWWIDLSSYSYAPAQRLAQTCGQLGRLDESLFWAKRVLSLLPDNAPLALEEARSNIRLLREAIAHGSNST